VRVVCVSKAFVRGAYQRKLEELARLPGVELTLVTPPSWTDGGHRLALERRYTAGYDIVVRPIRFEGHFHRYYFPGLGRLLASLRPDIVHADEEPYNLATVQMIRSARSVGARSLFFTWQNLYRRLPPPFSLLEWYIHSRSDYAIAGNQDARDVLQRKGFRKPIAVIPQFGVDIDLFQPSPTPREAGPFVIGYIGRLVESKGLLDLLPAVAGLAGDWRLELVGAGPLRAELERQSAALGIAEKVQVASEVPSTDVPRVLRGFDVLVLPSRSTPSWVEQFGRVLVEAMACAVPVVGSSSGEIPNVIGDAGLVFPEGKVEALRGVLARLADSPEERARLGALGRRRALERFTQFRIAQATYRVYQEMLVG
jgi:glycosyltransferase involved in cell wall biosynthesis